MLKKRKQYSNADENDIAKRKENRNYKLKIAKLTKSNEEIEATREKRNNKRQIKSNEENERRRMLRTERSSAEIEEDRLKEKEYYAKRKVNKSDTTKLNAQNSSLKIEWDYLNPCKL